jgi:hypothetical protein
MESAARASVESHLQMCGECRTELAMVEAVDQAEPAEDPVKSPSTKMAHEPADTVGVIRRWWDIVAGGLLRPAAAAVYLVIALAAIGLFISRPDRTGSNGAGGPDRVLGGVAILSDENGVVRGGGAPSNGTTIGANDSRFLLLELTGLDAPPDLDDVYTVRIADYDGNVASFSKTVTGAVFVENFTLCLFLDRGALPLGRYVVDVTDPDGNNVFRSSLTVE